MSDTVDGVTVQMVHRHMEDLLSASTYSKFKLLKDEDGIQVTVDDWDLYIDIDDELIPGSPYWWAEIYNPVGTMRACGKLQMHGVYKKSLEEWLGKLFVRAG